MELRKILKEIEKIKKKNPYPEDIFIEPTKKEYKLMRMALQEYNLIPDKFFGSEARRVWNLTCDEIIKELKKEKGN
jgi:hypothetical protein